MLRKIPHGERRKVILDAVEALIVKRSSTEFTMHELAQHVGISPTTFYNQFGSKGAVLYALLNRGLDCIIDGRVEAADDDDPAIYAVESMTFAAKVFTEKTNLYRPLYKFQLGERDMADRPSYLNRGLDYWRRSLRGLVDNGYLAEDGGGGRFTLDNVAMALLTHSSGVIDLWVQEDLTDAEFVGRMTFDAALIVNSVVPDAARRSIEDLIDAIAPRPDRFFFQ